MILLKPEVAYPIKCVHCDKFLVHKQVIWQGLHVCTVSTCPGCGGEFLCDLPHGQANVTPLILDQKSGQVYDLWCSRVGSWYTEVLAEIAKFPTPEPVGFKVERFRDCRRVIILNTLDFLYGHSLLELFNSERHLTANPEYGLIVLIQPFLRWLVPDGVAEVWTVDLPMRKARNYYPTISERIDLECQRFDEVYLSPGDVQPTDSNFTVYPHSGARLQPPGIPHHLHLA